MVYTRWGRTTCPNTTGTELVYAGIAAGSYYTDKGGGVDRLCLPSDPDYDTNYTPGSSNNGLYGTEYRGGNVAGKSYHNIPCAVCYAAARGTTIIIPAKNSCPSTWTLEYIGYLLSEHRNHSKSTYLCMDKDLESIPGSAGFGNMGLLYHVEATCTGIPCPPYNNFKELMCAVCTK